MPCNLPRFLLFTTRLLTDLGMYSSCLPRVHRHQIELTALGLPTFCCLFFALKLLTLKDVLQGGVPGLDTRSHVMRIRSPGDEIILDWYFDGKARSMLRLPLSITASRAADCGWGVPPCTYICTTTRMFLTVLCNIPTKHRCHRRLKEVRTCIHPYIHTTY